MSAKVIQKDINVFQIVAEAMYDGEASLVITKQEFEEIGKDYARWQSRAEIANNEKSERKMVLSRLSYLETWKKTTISNTQRMNAQFHTRLTDLELDKIDWENALYTSLKNRVDELEKRIMSDGRKTSLESRMTSVESAITSSPSRLTQDKRINYLENYIEETRNYIGGELDTITQHLAKTVLRVSELERLDGLHQMFSKQLHEKVEAFSNIYSNLQQIYIKHLNGRLRTEEAKEVSADISEDKRVNAAANSLAAAMINHEAEQERKKTISAERDPYGRFKKRAANAKR